MKFDIVVGNPPYLRGLHLKILEKCFDMLEDDGHLLFVEPADFLVQQRDSKSKANFDILKNKIGHKVVSVEFIDAKKHFDIGLYYPLAVMHINNAKIDNAITFIDEARNSRTVTDIFDINLIGDIKLIRSISQKIHKSSVSVKERVKQYRGPFFVNLSNLVGNGKMTVQMLDGRIREFNNKFNLVNNSWNKVTEIPGFAKPQGKKPIGNEKSWVSFETLKKAECFLSAINKTKLIKYLIICYNSGQNIVSCFHLFPVIDWEVSSDAELYEFFKLSSLEIQLIERTVDKFALSVLVNNEYQ